MAVVENNAGSSSGTTSHRESGKQSGSWFKRNKKLAIAGAAGIGILVLSHKGSTGTSNQSASQIASDAAAEQAAIDQAVGAASQTGDLSAGSAAGGGGGDSGTIPNSDTVASAAGPGPTNTPPSEIVINEGSPQVTVNSPSAGLQTPVHSAALTTGAASGDTVVRTAAGETVYGTPAQNQASARAQAQASEKAARNIHPPKPVKKGTKSAAMTIAHPTKPKTKTKGSVMKFGRAFPTAQSVHVGRGHTTSDGVLHEPVTVNYGGYTETHMSHNRGESWTDNVPGYTPPSRGTPLIRMGTA